MILHTSGHNRRCRSMHLRNADKEYGARVEKAVKALKAAE
jgi:hypothetical protein